MTPEEDEQVNGDICMFWSDKTGTGGLLDFSGTLGEGYTDSNAGVRLVRKYGFEAVMDTLEGTWECPRTAKYAWKDFSYWCEHYLETRSTLMAWRNKMEAQQRAKDRINGLPDFRQTPSGAFSIGKDSVCCECGAKGKNADNYSRCQDCLDRIHEDEGQPSLCPHGNECGRCKKCEESDAERNQCQHGNPSATCCQCSHAPNADCTWKECGKRFHAEDRTQQFCSPECAAAHKQRNDELMAKYAKPVPAPFSALSAFLDGQEQ